MSRRSSQRKRLQFDALERRETPSAGLGGAVDALTRPKPIPFRGSGTAVYVSATSAQITGSGTPLGSFSGTLTATSIKAGTAVLTTATGSLDLSTTGKVPTGKNHHFHGNFRIDSGTGAYANVKGGNGTLSGTLSGLTLSFTISGKIIE